jgi:hypothetical protein
MYLSAVDLLTCMVLIGEGTDRQGQGRGELAGDAILGQAIGHLIEAPEAAAASPVVLGEKSLPFSSGRGLTSTTTFVEVIL